ncbi:hypothetical protein BJ170DRAFT_638814 [Xylariales sp. AK1849]|nr:hypothetical protein BJ170DRAFT_638814 [Xylariales sp. AK1849]
MNTDEDNPTGPETPRRTSPAKRKTPNATPNRKVSAPGGGATPKSAPVAGAGRQRSATTKQQQPTLLGDFLLGRQTPGRVAAEREAARQRQMTLEQVKQEMRENAVRKVQAPGGVHDRVKQWQRKNSTAMATADPLATPSEPSEVNIQVDDESVTEEDRVRIKKGLRKKPTPRVIVVEHGDDGDETEKENQGDPRSGSPPKKRVVSDTNWMKNKRRSPPRSRSPKTKQNESSGSPLPKDFLTRPAANPPVKNKVKDWAARVEIPDEPEVKRYSVSRSVGSGDGSRARSARTDGHESSAWSSAKSSTRSEDHEIVVETSKPRKPRAANDDGIRITPMRKKTYTDDGIRVQPQRSTLPDDGIRVYSADGKASEDARTVRTSSRHGSARAKSARRDASPSERIEVIEESESDTPDTPTRRSSGEKTSKMKQKSAISRAETGTTMTEDVSESESWTSGSEGSVVESDMPSSVPSKLAEIPVGYSAFSELNLPLGGPKRSRPQAKRNSSFKGATNVLKKAFVESKKILSEKVDPPPKPAANQPRSIESWLNKTVDPFVEGSSTAAPEPKIKSTEQEWAEDGKACRSTSASKRKSLEVPQSELNSSSKDEEIVHTKEEESEKLEKSEKIEIDDPTTPTSSGLKRSRATRSASSPLKPTVKKGFKDRLKEAFRGESSMAYASAAEAVAADEHHEDNCQDRRRSSGSKTSPSSQDDESSILSSSILSDQAKEAPSSTYPKRRPPTNGFHELSTIMSEVSLSTQDSDMSSVLSDTTITQTTAFTKSTGSELSRHRSNKPSLKRRLTKHSDLVSALSLPDESTKVGRGNSLKSARSVRRTSNHLDNATVEGLLQEFARDEDLYQRELKTLVDGVIPVLLNQVVHGNGSQQEDLFASPKGKQKEDSLSKNVVQMGIALEKLRNAHKRCPLADVHRLPHWLESTQPIYDSYLGVWRLGFNDLIVNLAPLSLDDNDSLVNALPRNEQGDVLNEDGERVDVAHLLKRPLVRVKWINRFIKGYRTVTGTGQYQELATNWEKLQDKARRRHKEETARVVDEDATNTDTSRVRDLKTLAALDNVKIDRFRQVYAKDSFSLDLQHTNGQRLECQVELICRDNQLFKSDPGDILVRETGSGGRSWLLFAPIAGGQYSGRRGDKDGQLIVMVRGKHDEWFQLLTLTTDNEDQVLDWLEILGTNPVPPADSKTEPTVSQSLETQPKSSPEEAPVGEKKRRQASSSLQSPVRADSNPEIHTKTPSRYHQRTASGPATPTTASPLISEKTPTQNSYLNSRSRYGAETSSPTRDEDRSRSLREHMRPDPASLPSSPEPDHSTPPPPPAHRSLPSKKQPPTLSPPADSSSSRVKRRTSSPLKHEYHPSDVSSESSTSASGSDDEDDSTSDSSDDELEAADIPDTMPAISIKRSHEIAHGSVISDSTVSLTPSASASQAGLPKFGRESPAYAFKSTASISYWDKKRGCWKDLWPDACSIVTTPGLIEAYPLRMTQTSSDGEDRPLIALDLTPLVMLRNSTVLDLEIRSPVLSYARLYSKVTKIETSFFRFRATSFAECEQLYMGVHRARMDNAKYKALEEEVRVRNFGQYQTPEQDGDSPSHRRSWFGRKNSYRVSARAPSQSAGSTSHASSVSASSFLKRLMGGGNQSFNIAMSSVDKQSSQPGSREASLYTSSSSSGTPPRSPSISAANSGNAARMSLTTNNLKIRLHLMVSASKWEDNGNCTLEITRPDSGTRQNLRTYQGMEKRVVVTKIPKKESDKPLVVLDVVLGSRCFSRLGSRGILLNVWEEVRDEEGESGAAPKNGGSGGMVNKWCFQCGSVNEASWIFGLVTQEVVIS